MPLKWFLLLLVVLLFSGVASAQVPPTTIFQLDGNPANDNLGCTYGFPCDYWNLLNGAGGAGVVTQSQTPPTAAGNWNVRTFINGLANTNNFNGGGSKDPNPISQWRYTSTSTPNKDTLDGAYAAAYEIGGHFELIFGADRLSPNGDANIGIWFFQQPVGPDGSGGFTGAHMDHDVFIISTFTTGGGVSTITALEWDHTCSAGVKNPKAGQCADTNLRLLAAPATVCGSSIYCGITNSSSVNSSWEGSLASPLFFEGGVDLTAAFAAVGVGQLPCFSSFLVETRSSQSTTAVLKDFLAGGFPVCGINLDKSCGISSVDPSGTFINYPVGGNVKNTGVGSLSSVNVTDVVTYGAGSTNNTGTTLTINVVNNTTGSPNIGTNTLGAGETGTWSTTLTSSASSVQDVATAHGTPNGGTPIDSKATNLIMCSLTPSSTLKVNKNCSTTLVQSGFDVQVQVSYQGTVCNTGSSQITGLALSDFTGSAEKAQSGGTGPTPVTTTLAPCTSVDGVTGLCDAPATACTTYAGSYTPTSIDATATAGRFFFDDQVVISGAHATVGDLTKVTSSDPVCNGTFGCSTLISCPICDVGECKM
jgi:hypothetical protein